jgi:hypothetical protein
MKGVVTFVTYSRRKGTMQQSAAIMASITSLNTTSGFEEFLSPPITTELEMKTAKAMITNTYCQ